MARTPAPDPPAPADGLLLRPGHHRALCRLDTEGDQRSQPVPDPVAVPAKQHLWHRPQGRIELSDTGACSTNLARAGLATGIEGGQLAQPLTVVGTGGGGCCS
jgi:hypothetical protein